MNVRIFWVRAMKCMCAQTRPRFILSSEGVLGGMEFEPMLTAREKSPPLENVPRGGSNPWHCGQRAQALPTELFRPPIERISYIRFSNPKWMISFHLMVDVAVRKQYYVDYILVTLFRLIFIYWKVRSRRYAYPVISCVLLNACSQCV